MDPVASEILIHREHWDQMRTDVIDRAPLEACGLVAGIQNHSFQVYKITNILQSPVRFRLDPQQQLDALLMIEENNWDLLAIYHSHPAGPQLPSLTDIHEAAYPEAVNLIWYPRQGDWSCRAFRIEDGTFREVLLGIIDRDKGR